MRKDYVILIPSHFTNANAIAEKFMGYKGNDLITIVKAITDELTNDEDDEDEKTLVYGLTQFATACNNQDINLEGYFVTTVFTIG